MPLYLYIFEPRYKRMINECLRDSRPFGVILIRSGSEVGPGAVIHPVGTAAYITHVKPLHNGEMNIAAVGQSRFRVVETHNRNPYLTGLVEDFPLESVEDPRTQMMAQRMAPLVRKYCDIYNTIGEVEIPVDKIPDDPTMLAYLTAIVLNVPTEDKQRLLEVDSLASLLRLERNLLSREAALLKHMVENGPRWRDESNLFSPN
jgi:Lon protease-like protein